MKNLFDLCSVIIQSIYEILDLYLLQIATEFFFFKCTFIESLEQCIKNAPKSTMGNMYNWQLLTITKTGAN